MIRYLIILVFIATGAQSLLHAAPKAPVAAMHKPVGTVECNTEGTWKKAVPAMPLFSGDIVRTQENSFAIIKFLESSILRVQEKSEVEIRGTKSVDKEFSKNVHIRTGTVGFNVKHRPNEKFEFSTPTSVASIRGTDGALITQSDSSDLLVLGSGSVVFTNNFSNNSVTVLGGQTGHSHHNGQITVNPSSPNEVNHMRRVQLLGSTDSTGTHLFGSDSTHTRPSGTDSTHTRSFATDSTDTDSTGTHNGQHPRVIRIRYIDPDGNPKTLILKSK
jgi:hypothetical protein